MQLLASSQTTRYSSTGYSPPGPAPLDTVLPGTVPQTQQTGAGPRVLALPWVHNLGSQQEREGYRGVKAFSFSLSTKLL